MRPQASTRRSLGRSIFATALVIGLLAAVPASPSAGAQTAEGGAWTITTFAGTGETRPIGGDGGPATSATVNRPAGVAADGEGNVYLTNSFPSYRVRKVDSLGTITTVAGTGERGFSGDGGPATKARVMAADVALDSSGNLYIADDGNNRVRKVDAASGIITTVAGNGTRGSGGDGGLATAAQFNRPWAVAVDADDNLYIADNTYRVRKVDAASGIITTVAGNGERGFSGDGGPATSARLALPIGLDVDAAGNLFIADRANNRIRKVDAEGTITTVAGNGVVMGTGSYSGDGGPATAAGLNYPSDVAVHGSGILFIGDYYNNAIRRVDASGTIDTVAGTPPLSGFHADGGFAPFAALNNPRGLAFDDAENLYIADYSNNRIRRLETSYLWIDSDSSKVGESFNYTLNVSGLPTTASGVELSATLAPEVAFAGAAASQGSCANNAGTVSCELGTVEAGTTATVEITVNAQGAGVIPITATVSSEPEVIPGNRSVTAYTKVSAANCGQTITANTVLSEDIGPCVGNGVLFGADGITFDLGGKRIFGFEHPGDGHEAGVRVQDRSGITVKNGTVTDFDAGVVLEGGGSNTVTGMAIRDNIGPDSSNSELGDGVAIIESAGNIVANNVIANNGIYDGIGVLGVDSHNNTVEGNTIEGTVGPSNGYPFGQGIIVNAAAFGEFTSEVITGNKIKGNVIRDSASAGIANINNFNGEIVRNTVENNGFRNGRGNGIGLQVGLGLPDHNSNVLIQGNEVHGNALTGIEIPMSWSGSGAKENRILNNNATGNGVFDLYDGHPDCATNVWRNNTWGSGGYSPDCVTLGGNGPRAKPKARPEAAAEVSELPVRGKPAPSDPLGTP